MCLTEVKCVKCQVCMEREAGFEGARMGRFRPAGKEPLKARKEGLPAAGGQRRMCSIRLGGVIC